MSVTEIQARIASIQATFTPFLRSSGPVSGPQIRQNEFARELDRASAPATNVPEAAKPWMATIEAAAREAGIDPKIVTAVAWTESGFNPRATSGAGAIGLMQLMPGTAAGLGVNPHDPAQNVRGGARYLADQLERFGSLDLALAAYNAGPGAVTKHGGIPPYAETQRYVATVLDRLRTL